MAQGARVPKMAASVGDLRSLPLAPVDGFILSRVNGASAIRDIAAQTGLAENDVEASLAKLQGLGIVEFVGEVSPPRPAFAGPISAAAPPPPEDTRPQRPPPRLSQVMALGPSTYDVRELDETCDLEMDDRRRILDLFYRLDDVNYYQLLGVARSADKKTIKRSYFELAAHFHPDKHFRKTLGAFKQKMEIIFGRVTEAHDTLTSRERRPEYDQYLEVQEQARGIENMMASAQADAARAREELRSPTPTPPAPPPRTPPPPPAQMAAQVGGRFAPSTAFDPRREDPDPVPSPRAAPQPPLQRPATAPPQTPHGQAPAPREPSTPNFAPNEMRARMPSQPQIDTAPRAMPVTPIDPRAAREALARRLRGATGRPPPPRAGSSSVPSGPTGATLDAMDSLKRRYEDRIADADRAQSQKYKLAGDTARAQQDMVSAANAYRVAVSFDGEDAELQRLFKMTQEAADMSLAETYLKQATYEERNGRWSEAARSYARVAKAKPDNANVHDRLANAILRSQGNLHEAAAASKRAIEYGSAIVGYRLTLVNIYVAAGLLIAAKRELAEAQRMEPQNHSVIALVKSLEKTG